MTVSLNCSCSGKQFQIPINIAEPNAEPSASNDPKKIATIGDLFDAIAKTSGYPRHDLRVIWRGKSLVEKDCDRPLSEFNFKDKDKVMVLPRQKKGALTSDAGFSKLVDYEKQKLVKMAQNYDAQEKDLHELEKIMLDKEKMLEMCKKMDRKLRFFTEEGIRHMEAIDALEIFTEETSDEQRQRNREKRKSLINAIQDLLNKNDKFTGRVQELVRRLEHPEDF